MGALRGVSISVWLGAVGGALCWAVGSLALPAGVGTLLLAAGLLLAGALVVAASRRVEPVEPRAPLAEAARRRVLRLVGLGIVASVLAEVACHASPYAELATPAVAMVCGALLVPLAGVLDRRGYLLLGAALMVLGALGAVLALRSAGGLYPSGLVGLGAGGLLWLAAALAARLHLGARTRIGI
jgi:hypothetical protein